MEEHDKKQKKDGTLPVFLWIFLVGTLAVLLILMTTLLSRNGTFTRWKQQYKKWKAEQEEEKRAEHAGEKTVTYFGPADAVEYESWFAAGNTSDASQGDKPGTENTEPVVPEDPYRAALTESPVNGLEVWWKEAIRLTGTVYLYAQDKTPLYAVPERETTGVVGQTAAGERFRLFAVLPEGWYVVSDGRFYYCSEGNRYTMVQPTAINEELADTLKKDVVFYDVTPVLQKPELPHGCEVTGLAMLLSYYGVAADKCELADTWLPKGAWGETDFRQAFVGNPRKSVASAGCYSGVIADTANRYLKEKKSELTAEGLENVSFSELIARLEEGPVLAWTTMDLKAPYIAQIWSVDGEELYWQNYEHCVVLTGYDREKGIFYGNDPLYGPCEYDRKLFFLRFQTLFSQIVCIKGETS